VRATRPRLPNGCPARAPKPPVPPPGFPDAVVTDGSRRSRREHRRAFRDHVLSRHGAELIIGFHTGPPLLAMYHVLFAVRHAQRQRTRAIRPDFDGG
jgi:hypothetical protein